MDHSQEDCERIGRLVFDYLDLRKRIYLIENGPEPKPSTHDLHARLMLMRCQLHYSGLDLDRDLYGSTEDAMMYKALYDFSGKAIANDVFSLLRSKIQAAKADKVPNHVP